MTIPSPTQEELAHVNELEKEHNNNEWTKKGWRSIRRWIYDTHLYSDDEISSHMKDLGFYLIIADTYWYKVWDNEPDLYIEFTMVYGSKMGSPYLFFTNEMDAMHFKLLMREK